MNINGDLNEISYFTISEQGIEGYDKLEYDIGTLNLYDIEYQYVYFE